MEIYGVGRLLEWGEWWLLQYGCGHQTRFNRVSHRLFDAEAAEREVLEHYAECIICHPPRRLV